MRRADGVGRAGRFAWKALAGIMLVIDRQFVEPNNFESAITFFAYAANKRVRVAITAFGSEATPST